MPWLRALLAVLLTAATSLPALAAPTAEQREEIAAIGTLVTKAGNLYKGGKFKESGEAIKEAQSRLEKLAEGADEQLVGQLSAAYKRLLNAHALLELEGIKLPELKPLKAKDETPAPAAGGTSFVKDVAPILVARCGNCHVRNTRGGLSMATYESLMKGSMAGKVIFPKDAMGSTVIEKIEGKEMPPNGAGIPDAELATIKKWIAEGAVFDGKDPAANLTMLVTGATRPEPPKIEVKTATGKETISFSKDVAPVLAQTCTGCHGTNQPRNNFSLNTFEGLLRGGDSGTPILPGKGAESLLVTKLRGTAAVGQKMPLNLPPVAEDVISKIEKWIDEGAALDWNDPKLPIAQIAALAKARSSTHEELSADRAKLAEANWARTLPDIKADRYESANFLVLGNLGPNTLKEVADKAEALAPKVAAIFKAPADQPLVKGRLTLFVFKDRYDYGEFGKMVERRDLPGSWRGHFKFSLVDAYAAVLPPRADDYSLETLIAEQIAGCYIASLGKSDAPAWFATGAGRVAASRLDGGDARVAAWDDAVQPIVASMPSPDAFLTDKLNAEESNIAAYSFVKFLMTDSRKFQMLLEQLRKGGGFPQSFAQVYGGTPNQLSTAWVRKPPSRSTPKRGKK